MEHDRTQQSDAGSRISRLAGIAAAFGKLGCISFGGPVAHLSYLRDEFVRRRRWLDDGAYADLAALCQFLPGPSSSQVVFGLGFLRAGLPGALLASLCFLAPSLLLMILFGYGVNTFGNIAGAGWLHGLKLAAVAVVAQAVWGMGRALCPDATRLSIALIAAAALGFLHGPAAQILVMCAGAGAGWLIYRSKASSLAEPAKDRRHGHLWAGLSLALFLALLLLMSAAARVLDSQRLAVFSSFYRSGALVFGGGHVVLPLLRAELVPSGWVSDDTFLAGYGAAQALPGPLFTFGGYLGTVMHLFPTAWIGGLWCVLALFLPGWLLVGGALPFWRKFQSRNWMQASLRGANASVVGVLLAALYNPVWSQTVHTGADFATAALAFCVLGVWKWPPWLVVALAAAAGQWGIK